jgi:primosomal protein N' (replication factor Y)
MPPFGRLAALVVSDMDAGRAEGGARALAAAAPPRDGLRLLGPAPAPIARVRGRWRWRLLVEARRDVALQDWLRALLAAVKLPSSTRVGVDVDPYSFL